MHKKKTMEDQLLPSPRGGNSPNSSFVVWRSSAEAICARTRRNRSSEGRTVLSASEFSRCGDVDEFAAYLLLLVVLATEQKRWESFCLISVTYQDPAAVSAYQT